MNLRTAFVVIAVAALLGFLTWGLVNKGDAGLKTGEPVPVATLPTLPEGGEGSLADYKGDWVLLNVWLHGAFPAGRNHPRSTASRRDTAIRCPCSESTPGT